MERMNVGAERGAKIISAFCSDLDLQEEDTSEPLIVTQKKMRGQMNKEGERCFARLKGMDIYGMMFLI